MRISERIQYFLGVCLPVQYYLEFSDGNLPYDNFRNYFVCISIFIAICWGALYEGIRF